MMAVVVCTTRSASATVNAELLVRDPFEAGWSGTIRGRLSLSRGNVVLVDIGGSVQAQYQRLFDYDESDGSAETPFVRDRFVLRADGQFAEQGGEAFIGQTFVHVRWIRMLNRWLGPDLFAQLQYNRFLNLESRLLAGGGLRLNAIRTPSFMVDAGSAYMIERESIEVPDGADDRALQLNHRWTNLATMRVDMLEGRLLAQNTFYVQPRFDRFKDLRVLNTLEVLVGVTRSVALGGTFSVLFDSEPPTDVERTDLRFQWTIQFTL